ncbi:hypothetical protein L484_018678 [Morus notabilis]|uniref:Nuclease associated modular domain-containing protein n=1 Tax=Morus notabilis TaxID=981085 RepID=W9S9W4_9ROSA|nr:hypothetical protein L484_018678 [Morus notabilis]
MFMSWRLSFLHLPSDRGQENLFRLHFGYVVEYRHFPPIRVRQHHDISVPRNWSSPMSLVSSFPRLNSVGSLQSCVDVDEKSGTDKSCQPIINIDSCTRQLLVEDVLAVNRSDSLEARLDKDLKEKQRREKIGLANKGRVPWNKGKKHSAETRERIRQRTLEALNNPKVRQKMAECPRSHSDVVKQKIGSALRRLWAKRLKLKRSRETFFQSWAESIAVAAKTGGPEQEVLDWDSYDKIKQELVRQWLHFTAEKTKAKELARIMREEKAQMRREEKAANAIAEKMEMLVRKRRLREEKLKEKEEKAKSKRKLYQDKKDSTRRLKLKQRLSQIRQKISIDGQVSRQKGTVNSHIPALEKLDLELIKRESLQREISFADQIRAAKNKKAEFAPTKALAAPSCVHHSFSGKP